MLILILPTERMGDGEYEFADDGKLFNPPNIKLMSAKVKSAPAKGLVSTLYHIFLIRTRWLIDIVIITFRPFHKALISFQREMASSTTSIRLKSNTLALMSKISSSHSTTRSGQLSGNMHQLNSEEMERKLLSKPNSREPQLMAQWRVSSRTSAEGTQWEQLRDGQR